MLELFNHLPELAKLDWDSLADLCQKCRRCGLAEGRKKAAFGSGPADAPMLLIGEAPGEQEDLEGQPFVGRAGQLLTKLLTEAGIDRTKDLFITNIVKCRPPGNRVPHPAEAAACQPYLLEQIRRLDPKVILLAGSPASQAVLGTKETITKIRGKWQKMAGGRWAFPIFHPSYLLRNPSTAPGSPTSLMRQDLVEVKHALEYLYGIRRSGSAPDQAATGAAPGAS